MTTSNGPANLARAQGIADEMRDYLNMQDQDGHEASPDTWIALGQLYANLAQTSAMAANIRRNGAVPGLVNGWAEILTGPVPVDPSDGDPLDYAMFTVWLEGNWNWVTKKMTTEAREAAVAAVLRYEAHIEKDPAERLSRASLAWWDE